MEDSTNRFADIPVHLPEELVQTLPGTSDFRIERIVSLGHASPEGFWYDQEGGEWVLLLKGAARQEAGAVQAGDRLGQDGREVLGDQRGMITNSTPNQQGVRA
jgi:hypothetical protein